MANPNMETISHKKVAMVEGILHVKWMKKEVGTMNKIEKLQYFVIGKFTYEWVDIDELRTITPQQCDIKGDCHIGVFQNKHILIRLTQEFNFINIISKGCF